MSAPAEAAEKVEKGAKATGAKVKAALAKKVGPLPLGLWLVGIGGGLVLARFLSSRDGAATLDAAGLTGNATGTDGGVGGDEGYAIDPPEPVEPLDPVDVFPDFPDFGIDPGVVVDAVTSGVAGPSRAAKGQGNHGQLSDPAPPPGGYRTNSDWRAVAVADLGKRGWDRAKVDAALGDWLNERGGLDTQDRAIVAAAQAHAGRPPHPPGQGTPQPSQSAASTGSGSHQAAPAPAPVQVVGTASGGGTTNADWRRAIVERMGQGGWDRGKVDRVLGDWLNKRAVSKADQDIVNRAVQLGGNPPNGR